MDDSIISTTLQIRKSPKKTKFKKTNNNNNNMPIKVVYISNPMKVKTSASKFRALVQKLTGQDAAELPDPTNYTDTEDAVDSGEDDGNHRVPDVAENSADDDHHAQQQKPIIVADDDQGVPIDSFDDVFTPLMLENLGILPQGLFIYE